MCNLHLTNTRVGNYFELVKRKRLSEDGSTFRPPTIHRLQYKASVIIQNKKNIIFAVAATLSYLLYFRKLNSQFYRVYVYPGCDVL